MAKVIACAVRDAASDSFNRPFFVPSIGLAIRSFTDEVNRVAPENVMHWHPEHFELFRIGMYDEDSGLLEALTPPMSLAIASNVRVKEGV
ncbi:MAG: nonstructural protein [Microviridae sp.]|nr:MAG: nonstructural protein [Microviridae sp.]